MSADFTVNLNGNLNVQGDVTGGNVVSNTITINGKPLTENITLNAADVGARPNTWMPSASDVGAVTQAQLNSAIQSAISDSWGASY